MYKTDIQIKFDTVGHDYDHKPAKLSLPGCKGTIPRIMCTYCKKNIRRDLMHNCDTVGLICDNCSDGFYRCNECNMSSCMNFMKTCQCSQVLCKCYYGFSCETCMMILSDDADNLPMCFKCVKKCEVCYDAVCEEHYYNDKHFHSHETCDWHDLKQIDRHEIERYANSMIDNRGSYYYDDYVVYIYKIDFPY
jgi:hypothetical protein